jgi:hypothetical protein
MTRTPLIALRLGAGLLVSACTVFDEPLPECATHAECTEWLSKEAGSAAPIAGHCVQPAGKCVALLTDDCAVVSGDPLDDDAILLGSLLTEELRHTDPAILAVEELNSSFAGGGIPRAGNQGKPRPLALLSCMESATNPIPAARHLIETLQVPAIIGPDIDENALDIVRELIGDGAGTSNTALMSPTSLVDDLGSLADNDLMWRDVPSGAALAPLVLLAYTELEQSLRATKPDLQLGIVYRDDAFGQNAIAQISARVQFNGKPLADPTNAPFVRISKYPRADAQAVTALSAEYQKDPPDLMLLLGGVESITGFMQPLELALGGTAVAEGVTRKPTYLLFESNKVAELLDLVNPDKTPGVRADLRGRVRGVGLAPTSSSQPVEDAFRLAFSSRFGRDPGGTGMGSTYDAVYAFAAALAATASSPPSGASVAAGLAALSNAPADAGPLQVGRLDALRILSASSTGPTPTVLGTLNELKWHANGDYIGGVGELWCVSVSTGSPYFASGKLSMDLQTRTVTGAWTPCE